MFSTIWHTFFFDPIYNALIFFVDVVPGGDIGIAIILTVIVVKVILLPLSIKAAKTQKIMREIDPKIKELKKTITDSQDQARAIMAMYKESGINPFVSILLMLIQFPILIALYFSVYSGGGVPLPEVNTALLYSFIPEPGVVTMHFLGLLDITQKSLLLAVLAGVSQFASGYYTFPTLPPRDPNAAPSMKDDFGRSMQTQMKYVLPVVIGIVAYSFSAAIALYFLITNIVTVVQELFLRKHKA